MVVVLVIIFLALSFLGNYGPTLMTNDKCYSFLGCNVGFFGYDALVHFVNGIMEATFIVWLMARFPSFSLFHNRFWKNLLIVVIMVVFVAFLWEFSEFFHDQFRMKVLHENLTIPNTLDQPTNNDTMGDITFSILGAAITALTLSSLMRRRIDLNR
jgi:hypothetical protein